MQSIIHLDNKNLLVIAVKTISLGMISHYHQTISLLFFTHFDVSRRHIIVNYEPKKKERKRMEIMKKH
jgi:hypothetical protein